MPAESALFQSLDPIYLETELCRMLGTFIGFSSHALYFTQSQTLEPEYLAAENRLLLPIATEGATTAILRLDGVELEDAQALARYLPAITALALKNIELAKAQGRDNATGLHSEESLLELLAARIDEIQAGARKLKDACLGLLAIYWPDAALLEAKSDSHALGVFFQQMGKRFANMLPKDGIGARLGLLEGRYGFAALFPATGRTFCENLASAILDNLAETPFYDPFSHSAVHPAPCAGHALYPQDLLGRELTAAPHTQALKLRDCAKLAADIAWQTERLPRPALAYSWLAAYGARIDELPGPNFARINLGHNARLRSGQRFHIISSDSPWEATASKGQLIIRTVREKDALAEIFYVRHAAKPPIRGDGLLPIQTHIDSDAQVGTLLTHDDFLYKYEYASKNCERFALAITQFWSQGTTTFTGDDLERVRNDFRQSLARFFATFFMDQLPQGLAGLYGGEGLIIFHPNPDRQELKSFFEAMHKVAAQYGLEAASGIFIYPFLNFSREETEANALKTLEYAELLPSPHIGFMDALTLAINADKLFSQGNELGALEEYRLALLLKPGDAVILNSLGVCLAALSRYEDARANFREALANCQEASLKAQISYNLGNLFRKENDLRVARDCYHDCIKADPNHIYAWARLGQIYGKAARPKLSRVFYRRAALLAQGQPAALAMIQRQLARLEAERNRTEKAREILHDTLLRNPDDSAALLLLAQTYLADEPAMAEILARKCLRLGGDAWAVLAEALSAQGRHEEAQKASQKGKLM